MCKYVYKYICKQGRSVKFNCNLNTIKATRFCAVSWRQNEWIYSDRSNLSKTHSFFLRGTWQTKLIVFALQSLFLKSDWCNIEFQYSQILYPLSRISKLSRFVFCCTLFIYFLQKQILNKFALRNESSCVCVGVGFYPKTFLLKFVHWFVELVIGQEIMTS